MADAPTGKRARAFTASPYEDAIGFARAVRMGGRICISGTGPVEDDGRSTPGGADAQAERCFTLIARALAELGAPMQAIVRTRMYLTDPADAEAVGAAHKRVLGDTCPAATMVVVAALLRAEWKVEIEAEAVMDEA